MHQQVCFHWEWWTGKYCCSTFFIYLHLTIPLLNSLKYDFQDTYNICIRHFDMSIYLAKKKPASEHYPCWTMSSYSGVALQTKGSRIFNANVIEFAKIKPQDRFRKISQSVNFFSFHFYLSSSNQYYSRSKCTIVRNSSWNLARKSTVTGTHCKKTRGISTSLVCFMVLGALQ